MWKPGSKVKYTSRSGRETTRTIDVTDEGFASIVDNGEEFLFSKSGKPINTMFSPETGGPSIQLSKEKKQPPQNEKNTPNYKKATFEQPWDNVFALKNLTVAELHQLISELLTMGFGEEKLHLKNFGECANMEDKKKIRKIFLSAKKRHNGENN